LEIGVAAGFGSRIIMASQELASGEHDRFFTAVWTSSGHKFKKIRISNIEIRNKKRYPAEPRVSC